MQLLVPGALLRPPPFLPPPLRALPPQLLPARPLVLLLLLPPLPLLQVNLPLLPLPLLTRLLLVRIQSGSTAATSTGIGGGTRAFEIPVLTSLRASALVSLSSRPQPLARSLRVAALCCAQLSLCRAASGAHFAVRICMPMVLCS